MENKKPQNTPAPTKTPAKALAAKSKQPIPAKEEKSNANSSQATSSKTTKPAQASKTKANKPSSVKPAQPKPAIAPKVQTVAPKKVAQPTQKKPSVAVKANKESATQPSPKKPQSPIAKASANKVVAAKTPNVTKAEESAHSSKPKAIPEAKPASVPKGAPEAKPAPVQKALPEEKLAVKEQVKVPEQKTESKSAPSTLVKLATKGFVIQSWQIAVAVVVILVLVVGGVLLGTLLGNKNMDDPIVDYTGPLTNNNPDDPGNIALPGYPSLVFPANSKKVTLELPNPSGNPCYFRYTLTIAETDEVLYQSEPIQPGKMVKELTLNRALSQGTYTLRITIDTFSLADGKTPMNGGVQEVTVTVK